jgi:hypothetical protein
MLTQLRAASDKEIGASNGWRAKGQEFFSERGREQHDGAVTGTVWRNEAQTCHKVGSYRIEPDGTVTRYPTSTAAMRETARNVALAKYAERYGCEYPNVPAMVG